MRINSFNVSRHRKDRKEDFEKKRGDFKMKYEVQEHLHYAGIATWNHCPVTQEVDDADIVVMGVPFDSGVTFRPGARFAPRAIREQSLIACCFKYPWDYKLCDAAKVVDYGDVGYWVGAKATEFMVEDTYKHAKKILEAGCRLMTSAVTIRFHMDRFVLPVKNTESWRCFILTLIKTAPRAKQKGTAQEIFPMLILPMTCRKKAALIRPIRLRFISVRK